MEVYILDSLFRRSKVVDQFESLIWTERFQAFGDFELTLASTIENRNLFPSGTRIKVNESDRVMTVETIEDDTDEQGESTIKIKGRSLEKVLDDRLARYSKATLTAEPEFTIVDTPGNVARTLFNHICVLGAFDANDVIPNVLETNPYPADTIAEAADIIEWIRDPMSLYAAVKEICEIYDLGFRLVKLESNSSLYFNIYSGSNRTSSQTSLPAVIFSADLDNLKNTKELTSTAMYKNVAYVMSPVGFETVIADGVDVNISGFERRALWVKADDITDTVPADATAKMIQRGKEELAKNRSFQGFDGELSQYGQYKYGVDYNLGDLVEMRGKSGVSQSMRVSEQIFVSDREGERSYPTLALNQFIMPGTWLAWDYNQAWLDLDASPTTWADQ